MTLWSDFLTNDKRIIHKWKHYFPIYERHFNGFVYKPVTFFEIGCGLGGSLQMWKRYFGPHARIAGIDIDPACKTFEEDQIEVRIGDQSDENFLQSLIDEFGAPDIILDDGSHMMSHMIASFQFLYPRMAKNGIYMVEDLHTAYWDEYAGGLRKPSTFIELCKNLIDELNADHTRGALPPTKFTKSTLSMHFYDSTAVFERGTHTKKWAPEMGESASRLEELARIRKDASSCQSTQTLQAAPVDCRPAPTGEAKSLLVTKTFRFHEFEVPEHLSVFVGSVGAVFGVVAEEQLALLRRYIGLSPGQVIVEVGCGVGKAAIPIAKLLSGSGHYLGMDVSQEAIQWCQDNVTLKYPNVRFVHVDAKSSMYNASGQLSAAMIRFPINDRSVDRIFLMSVFTHMLEPDVRHYLAEFKRVMKPDALVLATWFIVEDGVLESARAKRSPLGDLRFEHAVSDGCYINDLSEPLGAVAYKRQAVNKMVSSSGLAIEKVVHGYWSHHWGPSDTGQDITILRAGS